MSNNSLGDFYYNRNFMSDVKKCLADFQNETYCMVAIDIEHFRLFNKLYGRECGDELILFIKDYLNQTAKSNDGVAGYLGADNFAVFLPDDNALFSEIRDYIIHAIHRWNRSAGFYPLLGVYPVEDKTLSPEIMYDRATLALSHALEAHTDRICRYTSTMESCLENEVLLLSEIEEALHKEEFTFFAQPQCDISTGKIVGAEALVRWQKSDGSLVSPGVFIPVLEKNGMIDQLDRYTWEHVCRWLHSWIDRGFSPVPISINVSRIDILSMDVPKFLTSLLGKYHLSDSLLKIEITESAYSESNDRITETVIALRNQGFKVMMDDFGCGYSSLNMLKTIPVDVLKLDMRFLEIDETEEEKGMNILESVVNMARLLRLPIVVEGVETEKQEKFVQNLGCRYTQGFYYYKPLPIDKFEELLMDDRHLDHHGLLYKQVEQLHIREFIDNNFISDSMLNNIMGPVAFYEMYDHQIEITRVNEQYFRLAGSVPTQDPSCGKHFWNHVQDDDRALLYTIFNKAYENPISGADGFIHFQRIDGTVLLIYLRVFFLKEKNKHLQFYGSLTDVSSVYSKKNEAATPVRNDTSNVLPSNPENYFNKMPGGFSINKVHLDPSGRPDDFDVVYANQALRELCGSDIRQLKSLLHQAYEENFQQILSYMNRVAYQGETVEFSIYSNISSRYMNFMYYQYSPGYVGSIMRDATHNYIAEKASESIMRTYSEVYYVHLDENTYRMLYPHENLIAERGNYEEAINRHFFLGKIKTSDENSVREFLSLEHLKKSLKEQDKIEMSYKRTLENNKEEWCLSSFIVSEREPNGLPKTAFLLIRSIETLLQEFEDNQAVYLSETLACMPDGFFIYEASESEQILFANERVLKIFGCDTMEDFRQLVHSSFKGMVYPDDLNRIESEISRQVKKSDRNMDYIKYRIIRKDGAIRWVNDCGHLDADSSNPENNIFYVFISDITDTITEAEKTNLINQDTYFK